jgi:hypothetical protein
MSKIEELEKKIKELDKQKIELQQKLEVEKQKTEFEYQFEEDEQFWILFQDGDINYDTWKNYEIDTKRYDQGNIFKTKQEAIRERDKRALLTRFRQFRDKCNGDWKPDWNNIKEGRYHIHLYPTNGVCSIGQDVFQDSMPQFGRFKNVDDCLRAIELFGDEIKRLFVEVKK